MVRGDEVDLWRYIAYRIPMEEDVYTFWYIHFFFYLRCSLLYFENLYLLHFCRRSYYSLVFYLTVFLLLHILGGEYIDALSFSWFQAFGWYLCFFLFRFSTF